MTELGTWRLSAFVMAVAFGLAALASCAARPTRVTLDVPASHPVEIALVEMEPGAAKVVSVGTYKVGKYRTRDLRVLEKMLARTVPIHAAREESFRVHLVVRSFLVVHSNNKGAGITCIAWALTNPEGELAYEEQFYASRSSPPLSIGGIKNRIHQAIVKRVHDRTQDLAAGRPISLPPEDTYDDFARAASRVPTRFRSEGPTIFGGYDQWGYPVGLHRSVEGSSQKQSADRSNPIDWYQRLHIPRPPGAPPPIFRHEQFPATGYEVIPPTGYPQ